MAGYDDATGWGSFNGLGLLAVLIAGTSSGGGGGGGGGGGTGPSQLLGNPGFENGANAFPWVATSGIISNSGEPAHGGKWFAWLDGYGRAHTDTLSQSVTIPATISKRHADLLAAHRHRRNGQDGGGYPERADPQLVRRRPGDARNVLQPRRLVRLYARSSSTSPPTRASRSRSISSASKTAALQTSYIIDFALNVQ